MSNSISRLLIEECQRYYDTFQSFTGIAKYQFEQQHWHDQRKTNIRRLDLSDQHRDYCRNKILEIVAPEDLPTIWPLVTEDVRQTSNSLPEPIINSFVLSVERSLYPYVEGGKDIDIGFNDEKSSSEIQHFTSAELPDLAREILLCPRLNCNYKNLESDTNKFSALLRKLGHHIQRIDVFPNLFFRNQHAYLVGMIRVQESIIPLGIAFINNEDGVQADAFFFKEEDIIRIFEFTRSYILANTKDPEGLFAFLHEVMPNKNIEQLIVNLGYKEWGKALIQKNFISYLESTRNSSLDHAPGVRGMVMLVFTSDDYPLVFKLIKDRIAYPKETTPAKVLEKYKLVARQDRVGRLADTQLFKFWKFPVSAFAPGFIDEMVDFANGSVEVRNNEVVMHRVFTERKMVPLNLYLESAAEEDAAEAIIDYGRAIKDLAMSNIFPGDLLTKNFGVTNEKRVVFYDYDEVVLLTDCEFKRLPTPRNEDELWDAETWTVARENDIFPEELEKFIIPEPFRELFRQHHGDLFNTDFWNQWKKFHEMEGFIDLQPY